MTQTYTLSPFTLSEESDVPWILWEQKTSVLSLQCEEQTDRRYVTFQSNLSNSEMDNKPVLNKTAIQRVQYNSVLSRMKQAAGKAGNYSDWQS